MKANDNKILTIAGKRVRVAYRKPGEDCCARCCFNGGETCVGLIDGEEWPCGKFNLATAYFVDAEQPEEDLEAEIERKYKADTTTMKTRDQYATLARHFAEWGAEHLKR